MSLKKKLILLMVLSGAILVLLLYLAFQVTLRPSQKEQKSIFVEKIEKRVRIALSVEEKNMMMLSANWAEWESMASYVLAPSAQFEKEVFPDEIFNEDMMDVVVITREDSGIIFYKGYKENQFQDLVVMNISADINRIHQIVRRKSGVLMSVVASGAGPMILVATPIRPTDTRRQTVGVLFVGRFIDQKTLDKVSAYTMDSVQALDFDETQLKLFHRNNMHNQDLFYREEAEKLVVYLMIKDFDQQPAMILYVNSDNEIFQVLHRHVVTLVIFIFLSIFILGFLIYFSIDKYIVKRVFSICAGMGKIEGLKDLSRRIEKDKSNDEISYLVSAINVMLDKLESEKNSREIAERSMITHGKLASIGRLTSSIGHEVNNPLLAISNSIQVIKKVNRSKSEMLKEAIEISESEISRIRDIISSLMDFHRFERVEFARIDVNEVISRSLSILEWSKKLGETRVVREYSDSVWICGSADKLKQVFMNFILNAVEAMENTGYATPNEEPFAPELRIQVDTVDDGQRVEVHFYDNGPGIPNEIKGHLFEPFVSTKDAQGVGLGLYISYKIIANHHGEIIYDAEYEQGTHFIIRLLVGDVEHCQEVEK